MAGFRSGFIPGPPLHGVHQLLEAIKEQALRGLTGSGLDRRPEPLAGGRPNSLRPSSTEKPAIWTAS
jgi:hypothetical protein